MGRSIQDYNGTTLPIDSTNLYGNIKDDPGGTSVDSVSNSDIQVFFQRMAALADVGLNGKPDNAIYGFQFTTALNTLWSRRLGGMAAGFGAAALNYANAIIMSGCVAGASGYTYGVSPGFFFYNGMFYYLAGFAPSGPEVGSLLITLSTTDAQPTATASYVSGSITNGPTQFAFSTVIPSPILTLQTQVATLNTEVAIGAFAEIASPGTGWSAISYANDGKGRVYLAGIATYATGGTALIGTLPAGSRPGFARRYVGSYQTGTTVTAAVFEILSSGTVSLLLPASGFSIGDLAYVDGIVFINGY